MKRPIFLFFAGLVLGEVTAIALNRTGFFVVALFLLSSILVYAGIYGRLKKKRSPLFLYTFLFCGCFFIGGLLFLKVSCLDEMDIRLSSENLNGTLTGQIEFVKETSDGEYQLTVKDCFFLGRENENTEQKEHREKGISVKNRRENKKKEDSIRNNKKNEKKENKGQYIKREKNNQNNWNKKYKLKAKCRILKIPVSEGKVYPGDQILCTGKLCAIEEPSNPGQFNSRIYYYSLGIHYQFLGKTLLRKRESPLSLYRAAGLLREKIDAVYSKVLSESEYGLLKAMFLGDKTDLSKEQKRLYEENGVAHLLAVSGLHVSIVGGMLFRFFRKRECSYAFSCMTGSSVLVFYAMMTGFGNSVFRAVVMFLCFLAAQYFGAEYDMVSSMSLAGILMLLDSPWRLLESGCIISFVSIFAIGMILPIAKELREKRNRQKLLPGEFPIEKAWRKKGKEIFFANLIISMVIGPLLLRFYYQWSPYSLVLNLFVIPAMSPLLLSAIAGGLLGIVHMWAGVLFCIPAVGLLRGFNLIFQLIRKLPGSVIVTGCPPWWCVFLLYIFLLLCFLFWYYRFWSGGIILTFFLLSGIFFYPSPSLQITMLDVGQGESIFIKMPSGETVLIDGGSTSKRNVAEYTILPALKYYGTDHLDYVIITHTDEDHISGIRELIEEEYPIKTIVLPDTTAMELENVPDDTKIKAVDLKGVSDGITAINLKNLLNNNIVRTNLKSTLSDSNNKPLLPQIKQSKIPVVKVSKGDRINFKKGKLICLYPEKGQTEENTNSDSLVFLFSYGKFTILFTGDLPGEKEPLLKDVPLGKSNHNRKPAFAQSDIIASITPVPLNILKIAHHGSKNSTTEAFLKQFPPEKAILSAGKNNLYGHPHKKTIEKVRKTGADIYGTLWGGAIIINSDGQEYSINYFKNN